MDDLKRVFFNATIGVFDFLEKDFGFSRPPEIIEYEDGFGDSYSAIRYIGDVVAIDVIWYHGNAAIDMIFTELTDGKFLPERSFWGNIAGKSRAISLYSLVVMNQGNSRDFILGDMTQLGLAKIKKRDELIKSELTTIIQNLRTLCVEFASEVIRGDLSIFPAVMKYQGDIIDKIVPKT